MKEEIRKALVVDADVLVHNPESVVTLRKGGNVLYIPWAVFLELSRLKERPESRLEANEAAICIEEVRSLRDNSLRIFRDPSFANLTDLDKRVAKHHVIATAKTLQSEMNKSRGKRKREIDFEAVEIVSREPIVRILAGAVGIVAQDFYSEKVEVREYRTQEIHVPASCIHQESFPYQTAFGKIEQNEGVVCISNRNPTGEYCRSFAAIRKGDIFKIIPHDIKAAGIGPYSLNGNGPNWSQYIALAQLLDPKIELVFLQGGAGSGKTLLALASAIEQENNYRRIIITRPMVHLEDEDNMGYLPGGVEEKMAPWLQPITQNLELLKSTMKKGEGSEHKETDSAMAKRGGKKSKKINRSNGSTAGGKEKKGLAQSDKIQYVPLNYIRGATFHRTLLIVDEAQNLTPHQAKTIITRAGVNTKIILTGDLGQIDRRKMLTPRANGLAYAIATMGGPPSVGVTTFKETVRSHLASLAEERM